MSLDLETEYEDYLRFCEENNFKAFTFNVFKALMEAKPDDIKRHFDRTNRKDS